MPVQFHPFISGRWELANNDYIKHDEWYKSETGNSFAFIPDHEMIKVDALLKILSVESSRLNSSK